MAVNVMVDKDYPHRVNLNPYRILNGLYKLMDTLIKRVYYAFSFHDVFGSFSRLTNREHDLIRVNNG